MGKVSQTCIFCKCLYNSNLISSFQSLSIFPKCFARGHEGRSALNKYSLWLTLLWVSSINLFGLWSITVLGTCTMLMMAVLKVSQISYFCWNASNIAGDLHSDSQKFIQCQYLMTIINGTFFFSKRRRENVLDHTMMTWVFYQSHLLSEARKQDGRKSSGSV